MMADEDGAGPAGCGDRPRGVFWGWAGWHDAIRVGRCRRIAGARDAVAASSRPRGRRRSWSRSDRIGRRGEADLPGGGRWRRPRAEGSSARRRCSCAAGRSTLGRPGRRRASIDGWRGSARGHHAHRAGRGRRGGLRCPRGSRCCVSGEQLRARDAARAGARRPGGADRALERAGGGAARFDAFVLAGRLQLPGSHPRRSGGGAPAAARGGGAARPRGGAGPRDLQRRADPRRGGAGAGRRRAIRCAWRWRPIGSSGGTATTRAGSSWRPGPARGAVPLHRGLDEPLPMPMAHGEGRFVTADAELADGLAASVALRYARRGGRAGATASRPIRTARAPTPPG